MKMYLACMKCFAGEASPKIVVAPLEDSGRYRMKCEAGHETETCLRQLKFEVLIDLAAHAIVDGYYREAVLSFTSGLERFFEFYIEVECIKRDISDEAYKTSWKLLSNQSERQLGAFVLMHPAETKQAPVLLSDKYVSFRNSVVHKGKIPSRVEALEYGEQVCEVINALLTTIRETAEDSVRQLVGRHVARLYAEAASQSDIAIMSIGTLFSLSRAASSRQPSLAEWIEMLESQKGRMLVATAAQEIIDGNLKTTTLGLTHES